MSMRSIKYTIPAMASSDGAGVRIRRSLGQTPMLRMDPFLMMDAFGSDQASDYIAGFPAHPHRGFETITYMIDGHMRHEDHLGNSGDLQNGGVQWMTAGRGIIHSEMPQQESGLMRGFQIWLNLPAADKMQPAGYRDLSPDDLTQVEWDGGAMTLIAGDLELNGEIRKGPVHRPVTEPVVADLRLEAGGQANLSIPSTHQVALYLYEGSGELAGANLRADTASVLGAGERISVTAGPEGGRLMLIAGKPLNEPVVQYGPFVMASREDLEQAMRDYRDGTLTA